MIWIVLLHWLAGFVVLAEALNKLERTDLFDGQKGLWPRLGALSWLVTPWRWKRARVASAFKALGWACLSIGAAGAVVNPLLHLDTPGIQDTAIMCGFALLVIRTRIKETLCEPSSQV